MASALDPSSSSSSSKTVPATRQACNRCHAAKLRCPRSARANGPCARCIKAGAECVYDPPLRLGRPRHKNPPPTPHPVSEAPVQKRKTSPSSREEPNNHGLAAARPPSGRGPRSPVQASLDGAPGGGVDLDFMAPQPESIGLDMSKALPCLWTDLLGLKAPTDLYPSDDHLMQTDEPCFFTDLLAPGPHFNVCVAPSPSVEPCHDSGHLEYPNPPVLPISTTRERSCSGSTRREGPPENLVLAMTQLQAELNRIHHELNEVRQSQSCLAPPGRTGQGPSPPADCIKTRIRANIEVSEKTLEILGRINNHPSRLQAPDRTYPVEDRPRRDPRTAPRPRNSYFSYPGPFSAMADDDPDDDPPDPQSSIMAMLLLSIYLGLLHNFDILVSMMSESLTDSDPMTPAHSHGSMTPGPAFPAQELGPMSHNPGLDVSLGDFSFSSPSARSLHVVLNVQLITTLLAKIKASIHRMVSAPHPAISSSSGTPYYPPGRAGPARLPHSANGGPPHAAPGRPAPASFAAGIDRAVEKALAEMDYMDSSLQGRAESIRQWTIERT